MCLETATVMIGVDDRMSNMAAYLNRHLCVAGLRKKRRLLTVATELLANNFVLCVW